MSELLGIGGAHIDRIGYLHRAFAPGVSNPGKVREWVGGCMANTLRAARALGGDPVGLIAARGGDPNGKMVARMLEENGIADYSAVFLDRATPSYMAIMDNSGEVVAALADMDIYEAGLARHLRRRDVRDRIARADRLVVDANLPEATIDDVCALASAPVVALAVSKAKAQRLRSCLGRMALAIMNRGELSALAGVEQADHAGSVSADLAVLSGLGLRRAIVTMGAEGALVFEQGRCTVLPAVPVGDVQRDVTGAGDALAGAVIANWPARPLIDAVRLGLAAASVTISGHGPFATQLATCDLGAIAASIGSPEDGGDIDAGSP